MEASPPSTPLRIDAGSRPARPVSYLPPSGEPFDRVLELGADRHIVGVLLAFLLALFLHGAAAARVAMIQTDLLAWTHALRLAINERLAMTYDIDVPKPPPPPETPAPEPPKPEEKAPPPAPKDKAPPPPPAAAQAGKVLTQEPDDTPVDFTNSFVTGTADTYAGGVTQATGTSAKAVYDRSAQVGGVPGGTGAKPAPPAPGVDRSRALSVANADWHCDFPPEADSEQIDEMQVPTQVSVSASGRVTNARALKDPGYGFARAAVQCALRQGSSTFNLAYDKDGNPIAGERVFNVHFTR
jgi:periplasmic protein TonB